MKLCDVNPFLRYAELQPSVMAGTTLRCSYDYRIFYILEGNAELAFLDRIVPLSPGMLIYFRPGTPYNFDGKVKSIVLNFDMTRGQASQTIPRSPSKSMESFDRSLIFENDPPLELQDIVILENAFETEPRLQECLLRHCYPTDLSDAVTSAILKTILCDIAQHATQKNASMPEAVQRIMLLIRQNYDKDLSNSQISDALGYHSFYLNRMFKKSTGITIHQALIQERMSIAKRLLKETSLSVNAIASEVGFTDHTRFCTAFKKCKGVTPLEYRKRALQTEKRR
jgi:AraC-like DNA-binding protein